MLSCRALGSALARREGGVAAVPGDLGRHALVGLALAAGVVEQRDVGVGVHVDESRAYDVAGGVDAPGRLGVAEGADGLDPAIGYAHVALVAGRVRAVDDGAIQYEDVVCHGLSSWDSRLCSHTLSGCQEASAELSLTPYSPGGEKS